MRGRDWLLSLAGPVKVNYRAVDWSDVLVRAEAQPDPAGWLAGHMGVTRRTGERYLAAITPGARTFQGQPTRGRSGVAAWQLIGSMQQEADKAAEAEARAVARGNAADLLRLITAVDVGTVSVQELSGPRRGKDGDRRIGTQEVDLGRVADLVDKGAWTAAEDALSGIILDAYGEGLSDVLSIEDYESGIDYA